MIKSLLVLVLTFGMAVAAFAQTRIVGGEPVTDIRETPYIVSLSGVCAGSIIADRWVLTAAHCAGHFREAMGGTLDLNHRGHIYQVKQVISHPQYNPYTSSNDFALVELTQTIDFNATGLRPVRIATPKFASEGRQNPGVMTVVYGWGNIGEGTPNRLKTLNRVQVPIVTYEEANARDAYNGKVDATMIPAGYPEGKRDACQGDSGGPQIIVDVDGLPTQIGVVSWGEGFARAKKYGLYSNIATAFEWIRITIGAPAHRGYYPRNQLPRSARYPARNY